MIEALVSRDNSKLKLVRSLSRKKGRLENGLFFVEGIRITQEALQEAENDIKFLLVSETFAKKNKIFAKSLDETGNMVYTAKDDLFREVCDTEHPQGIGAVVEIPNYTDEVLLGRQFILALDGVADPGNMGTMIRTAEAVGVDAVVLLGDCVDVYNPKTVRSTMGAIFRMPIICETLDIFDRLKGQGVTVVATALRNAVSIEQIQLEGPRLLIIGSEARGVSESVLAQADITAKIPMKGKAESLNAAVAAGISMYMLKP